MAKALKFNLRPQSQIPKEGDLSSQVSDLPVGQRKIDFSIPDLEGELEAGLTQEGTPKVQQVVDRINQYIDNIADDYFLLGLHLIALHKMLKKSGLTTEQIKLWYAENINMPYSSAMQCRKVALVYQSNPDLINRYTASGAYLLSSCASDEEREEIWAEARGKQPTASVRQLRETLKRRREMSPLEPLAVAEEEDLPQTRLATFRMLEVQIHEALQQLTGYAETMLYCTDQEEKIEMRYALMKATMELVHKMEELI